MGYDVHITRAKRWPDSESNPISATEWLAIVESDPDLRLAGKNGAYFAFWNVPESKDWGAWLNWYDGRIVAKNPDESLIEKMVSIAKRLNATVQGDDGEYYRGNGESPYQVAESLLEKFKIKLHRFTSAVRWFPLRIWAQINPAPCEFYAGQRVRDHLGREALVFNVDRRSPTRTPVVSIRYPSGMQVHHVGASASKELKVIPEEFPN